MELKDIVIAAGNENVNAFEKDFKDLLMIKINSQINNTRKDVAASYNTKPTELNV